MSIINTLLREAEKVRARVLENYDKEIKSMRDQIQELQKMVISDSERSQEILNKTIADANQDITQIDQKIKTLEETYAGMESDLVACLKTNIHKMQPDQKN